MCDELTDIAIKHKLFHKHYIEMLSLLMTHFNSGVAGITNNSKGLFKLTIQSLQTILKKSETIGKNGFDDRTVNVLGKNLEDAIAVIRL